MLKFSVRNYYVRLSKDYYPAPLIPFVRHSSFMHAILILLSLMASRNSKGGKPVVNNIL